MILVDTGPLVGLFDATDHSHAGCRRILSRLDDRLATTLPVLTEAFHLLRPLEHRVSGLIDFIRDGGAAVIPLEPDSLSRCFELMQQYADLPMDFADASIVAAAEQMGTDKVFTLDHKHFGIYRLARGYHRVPFNIVGDPSGPQLVREGAAETEVVAAIAPASEEPDP